MNATCRQLLVVCLLAVGLSLSAGTAAFADHPPGAPEPLAPSDVAAVESMHVPQSRFDTVLRIYGTQVRGRLQGEELREAYRQIIRSLVEPLWYRSEADQLGIVITRAEARKRLARLVRQTFPERRDYRRFLAQTRQTPADLLKLVIDAMRQERVLRRWSDGLVVTEDEVAARYAEDPSKWTLPAVRDIRVVYTRSRAKARAARRALDRGARFSDVARRYSEDRYSRRRGGRMEGITPEQFEPKLDRAVFRARKGRVVGPVKTSLGYYVFVVDRIAPPYNRTLAEAATEIRDSLRHEKLSAKVDAFVTAWKASTLCRAAYAADVCGLTAP